MLDTATKKRIDDCRDILVGKLPDPKAQIEQITIGLIYKFMDDMDKEAIELGGKAKFFSGDFEKYSWDALFDAKVTAHQMLSLYSDAIMSMDKNPNIPQLFRDIFKNAYLPYRDPETLKMFLNTISEFEYTHSEKLGDAFEYLLSVMGSQGDAGQFRTPRHIIDFLVAVVDPGKTDTILDPACGTAGFLISAFKHIKEKNNNKLTPDERKMLIQNSVGYDISPDMVRLSLVNLYLHGFSDPHISEYDTLSSEERWDETFDVILANPPFMSPKGGIRPHKRFTISSNRSEVLFVDYIAEHLNPKGRAGIIVPEGVIFQSGTAYKDLRKMLVENYLYAVVSLPAGIFNPYSGVKTSILLMDKELSKTRKDILFVKVANDGFNLGAQRNAVKGGQLEDAIEKIKQFKSGDFIESEIAQVVSKTDIGKNGDYNLSGERYKLSEIFNSNFLLKKIEDVCLINPLKSEIKNISEDTIVSFVPMSDLNENNIDFEIKQKKSLKEVYNSYTYFADNDVLIAKVTPCFENGKAGIAKKLNNSIGFGSSEFYVLRTSEFLLPEFLYRLLKSSKFYDYAVPKMTGTGGLRRVPRNVLAEFIIPLPPLSVQEDITLVIREYQKIIDGAKMAVENYKPKIDIDPKWEMIKLEEVIKLSSGKGLISQNMVEGPYPVYGGNGINGFHNEYLLEEQTIVIGRVGAYCGAVHLTEPKSWVTDNGLYVTNFLIDIEKVFLAQLLTQLNLNRYAKVGGQPSISQKTVTELSVSIPNIETQRKIVSQIEKEMDLVNASKQLIEIFEQKVKDRISKVWGE